MNTTHTIATRRWIRLVALLAAAGSEAAGSDRRIRIQISERKLYLLEEGQAVRVYDIAVGADATPTPRGVFEVANRIPFPTWYSRRGVVRPGAANPLGTRWIGLSKAGYGIHGTNAPESIGRAASHGCVRMRNRDVEELFALIGVGTPVEVVAN